MRKIIGSLLVLLIISIFVIIDKDVEKERVNAHLKKPLEYEQIQEKIKDSIGMDNSLTYFGYLEELADGSLRLRLAKDKKALDSLDNKNFTALLNELKEMNISIEYNLAYTPKDIDHIATLIFNDIRKYYADAIDPKVLNFRLIHDYKQQKVIISQDRSKEKLLDTKLINELKEKYSDLVNFKEEENIPVFEAY